MTMLECEIIKQKAAWHFHGFVSILFFAASAFSKPAKRVTA
jgi:lipid-A-disaccharide synthase-like uncharacterized protein